MKRKKGSSLRDPVPLSALDSEYCATLVVGLEFYSIADLLTIIFEYSLHNMSR